MSSREVSFDEVVSLPDEEISAHASTIIKSLEELPIDVQLDTMKERLSIMTSFNREAKEPEHRRLARGYALAGIWAVGTYVTQSRDELSQLRGESNGTN
ncbi:hypothetical protein KW792_01355 [Candidatus Saccharibacteria bacterium]|nr:hypothetical protein [Candidatus Saccharibacteria bacterium]